MSNLTNSDIIFSKNNNEVCDLLDNQAKTVVELLYKKKLTLATAESCTGGMLSQSVTSVSGASEVFEVGVCSYSNRIKTQELSVPAEFFESFGAVSEQVAVAMADGIVKKSGADIGVGITGIAGPNGGTVQKPVGTVFVAVTFKEKKIVKNLALQNAHENLDRDKIRKLSTISALEMILEILQ